MYFIKKSRVQFYKAKAKEKLSRSNWPYKYYRKRLTSIGQDRRKIRECRQKTNNFSRLAQADGS
jgi:hypothetical protein